jgi:hypothetical protein
MDIESHNADFIISELKSLAVRTHRSIISGCALYFGGVPNYSIPGKLPVDLGGWKPRGTEVLKIEKGENHAKVILGGIELHFVCGIGGFTDGISRCLR